LDGTFEPEPVVPTVSAAELFILETNAARRQEIEEYNVSNLMSGLNIFFLFYFSASLCTIESNISVDFVHHAYVT